MDTNILQQIGLTHSQSEAYVMLVKNSPCLPSVLAKLISESRTNTYKILEKLEQLELVSRDETGKKLRYWANNPTALLGLVEKKKRDAEAIAKQLEANLPALLSSYLEHSVQPGVQYYQGKDGLKQIYLDQIKTRQPIYIIRPHYNMDGLDFDYLTDIRRKARDVGIQRFAITPDRPLAPKNYKESDPYMLLERTWMKPDDYTAPVEWNAYGDKVAIMSFGKESIGLILDSPQIAEALRQLYRLLARGLKIMPGYNDLPLLANFIADIPGKQAKPLTAKQQELAKQQHIS